MSVEPSVDNETGLIRQRPVALITGQLQGQRSADRAIFIS